MCCSVECLFFILKKDILSLYLAIKINTDSVTLKREEKVHIHVILSDHIFLHSFCALVMCTMLKQGRNLSDLTFLKTESFSLPLIPHGTLLVSEI